MTEIATLTPSEIPYTCENENCNFNFNTSTFQSDFGERIESYQSNCTFLTMEEKILLFKAKFWLEGVVQLSFAVLGVTTNLVSIYVLSRRELSNTFNQENIYQYMFSNDFEFTKYFSVAIAT